ncbi:MAG: hypothetical protein ACREDS_14850 [Limisphaerales bacterium]
MKKIIAGDSRKKYFGSEKFMRVSLNINTGEFSSILIRKARAGMSSKHATEQSLFAELISVHAERKFHLNCHANIVYSPAHFSQNHGAGTAVPGLRLRAFFHQQKAFRQFCDRAQWKI